LISGAGLLDRYVMRRLLSVWGLCILSFVLLFLVVDSVARLDDFTAAAPAFRKAGISVWGVALRFYLTKIPEIVTLVGPYLTLFAAIATFLTIARQNEYVPMIVAGRSAHRVLLPVYAFAAISAAVLAVAEEAVVPQAARENEILGRMLKNKGKVELKRIPHLRDGPNAFAAARWLPAERRLVDVTCPLFRDPAGKLPDGSLSAAFLEYGRNPLDGVIGWYPRDGELVPRGTDADGRVRPPVRLPPDVPLTVRFGPSDVEVLAAGGEPGITRAQLLKLRRRYPMQHGLTVDLHQRFTRPLSSVVLLLLGIPFVARVEKRTVAAGLGIALGVCAAYFGVDFLCREVGQRGDVLDPAFAVWLPPVFFTAVALSLFDRIAT